MASQELGRAGDGPSFDLGERNLRGSQSPGSASVPRGAEPSGPRVPQNGAQWQFDREAGEENGNLNGEMPPSFAIHGVGDRGFDSRFWGPRGDFGSEFDDGGHDREDLMVGSLPSAGIGFGAEIGSLPARGLAGSGLVGLRGTSGESGIGTRIGIGGTAFNGPRGSPRVTMQRRSGPLLVCCLDLRPDEPGQQPAVAEVPTAERASGAAHAAESGSADEPSTPATERQVHMQQAIQREKDETAEARLTARLIGGVWRRCEVLLDEQRFAVRDWLPEGPGAVLLDAPRQELSVLTTGMQDSRLLMALDMMRTEPGMQPFRGAARAPIDSLGLGARGGGGGGGNDDSREVSMKGFTVRWRDL